MEIQIILESGLWHDDIFSETLELAIGVIPTSNDLRRNTNNIKKIAYFLSIVYTPRLQ